MRNQSFMLVIISCVGLGCESRIEPKQLPPRLATTTQPLAAAPQPHYGWYQARDEEADHIIVTKLSIPGLFEEHTEELKIARYVQVDADGEFHFPPEGRGMMTAFAHGRNEKGGFGYGGAINFVEDYEHDDAVVLDVNYYWTTPDQVRGQLKEMVPAKIGTPLDVQLPGGCRLQVNWRAVAPGA